MLQVIVNRNNYIPARCADSRQERAVLTVVAHQVDASEPVVLFSESSNRLPALVGASIIHEYDFVSSIASRKHRSQTPNEFRKNC